MTRAPNLGPVSSPLQTGSGRYETFSRLLCNGSVHRTGTPLKPIQLLHRLSGTTVSVRKLLGLAES